MTIKDNVKRCPTCGQRLPKKEPVFNHALLEERLEFLRENKTIDGYELLLKTSGGASFSIEKNGNKKPVTLNAIDSLPHPTFESFLQMSLLNVLGDL